MSWVHLSGKCCLSAKHKEGISDFEKALLDVMGLNQISALSTLVTNLCHYQHLCKRKKRLNQYCADYKRVWRVI